MLSIFIIGAHSAPLTPPPRTNIVKLAKSFSVDGEDVAGPFQCIDDIDVTVIHFPSVWNSPVASQGR